MASVLQTFSKKISVRLTFYYNKCKLYCYYLKNLKNVAAMTKLFTKENHAVNSNVYCKTFLRWMGCLTIILFTVQNGYSQQTVSGTVRDENQTPLPGVNVIVKGTTQGTTTDVAGTYSIAASPDAVLVFTFIGYTSQEVSVGQQTIINVAMAPDVRLLSEVVVVGYGTQKKSDLTGAVSIADPKEMAKQAASNVTQLMQGRIAGVSITSDGQPGANPNVRIRGVGTFGTAGTSAEPLYVVDGFPLMGGIRDINPNDIETIQVLKDATSGAIYGNRAANGVVIITTKSGKKNEPFSVGFNAYYGFQGIPQRIPVLGRTGYQMISNEALTNAGLQIRAANDPTSALFVDDVDTDWQDVGYKDGYIQNYNANISGGTKNTNFYMSMDYLDNVGTLVGTGPDYKRYSFRVNSETKLGRIKLGENVFIMRGDEHPLFASTTIALAGNRPSLVNDLLQAAPIIPLYDPSRDGGFGGSPSEATYGSITLNVPGINTLIENSTSVTRVLGNIYGELEISKGLNFRSSLQYDKTSVLDELFVPTYDLGYFFTVPPSGQLQIGTRNYGSMLIENTLSYDKVFGDHDLKVLVGQTYQDFDSREIRTFGTGLQKPYIRSLGEASSISATDDNQPAALASFLGRVNYAYKDRYLLTLNIRRDGSSKFREENRWEYFPSLGLAWKIHNSFALPPAIAELKLRGGVGQVGNQQIPNFRYYGTVNRAIPYQFGNTRVLGAAVTNLVDESIRWETRTTRNVAIDASLFEGAIEFTVEYYSNTSDDVLMDLPIPTSNGSPITSVFTNAGSISNSGIELSAQWKKSFGDFSLDIAPNFYTVKNEVLDIGPRENLNGTGARTEVGTSIGEHYGYVYEGIFQNANEINTVLPGSPGYDESRHAFQSLRTSPGDIRFKDIDGNGIINADDRQFLGSGMPTYHYGLNIVANYKHFDLTIFGNGSGGNLINSNIYRGLMSPAGFGYTNRHTDILNRWTPENTDTEIPRIVHDDPNGNGRDSDRPGWLQKGDYFRLNTVSLGYSIPASVLNKARIKSFRVYFTVQNVHTFTKYKGYNPDFQAGILNPGFDYGTFPRPRTTMVGVQLKF
jgi:TonB-dependent starch-binding outer membrane protein SusC